jgi:hypothetical protein
MRALLLDVGSRHDFGGKVQPFTEVLEAFGGEGVVVVLPGKSSLEEAARGKRLASLDDLGTISSCTS